MLNKTLFVKEIKSNYKLFLIFTAVLTMYMTVIITMFDPNLGQSLEIMKESMPEIFAAFGMQTPGTTLLDFLINYLYGFLFMIFPMVFLILLTNKLIARYVDRGSMVYLLTTPNTRRQIVTSQALFMLTCTLFQVITLTLITLLISTLTYPGELAIPHLLTVNLGLLGLHLFLGSLCFLTSCLFNDTRYATGTGAALCILFVLTQMLSQVTEDLAFLKYATPLTLFQPNKLAIAEPSAIFQIALLYLLALLFTLTGIHYFTKKDLSI